LLVIPLLAAATFWLGAGILPLCGARENIPAALLCNHLSIRAADRLINSIERFEPELD